MRTADRVELKSLKSQDRLVIDSVHGREKFTYEVEIIEAGDSPLCTVIEKNEAGNISAGPVQAILEGTGIKTTPDQNPTQRGDWLFGRPYQEVATTIYHGTVSIGENLVFCDPELRGKRRIETRSVCNKITVYQATS